MTFEQVMARLRAVQQNPALVQARVESPTPEVVWSGGELLPEREEHHDSRFGAMPTMDLDEDAKPAPLKRAYNKTGRYAKPKDLEQQAIFEHNLTVLGEPPDGSFDHSN
jgi:hypothetical protein